jgi:predicted PolB exonuclease-like 3'-5' exonuclease
MAGIYAEFGKIVCISVGIFRRNKDTGELEFHVKSFYSDDERQLLLDFANLLEKHYNNPKKHYLCGHNIREFDIPYICRRMIIQGMNLPDVIDLYGKKPWETEHLLDTLALWRFGDYKNFTSLKLLCGVFDIPTPKDDIDGSEVGKTYWEDKDLDRIEVYCKKDVVATAQLLLRFKLEKLLREDQIFLR